VITDDFRIACAAGGARYYLKRTRWRGPNTGESCGTRR